MLDVALESTYGDIVAIFPGWPRVWFLSHNAGTGKDYIGSVDYSGAVEIYWRIDRS